MPIYEYVCCDCKDKFEVMRPFSKSTDPADCPTCKGKGKGQRVLSRFACFTTGESGAPAAVGGGGGCGGCSSTNCGTCHS